VIKQAKTNTGLKSKELADFLGVAESTLYNWEKRDNWPSWALKKVGILESKSDRIQWHREEIKRLQSE
tara:strand:- start:628 stop:831 length:204 start_codon:yes stop_codon:yes gene_type:complete